jgi:diguanylate cyclase (GGDEF)-like protein
MDRHSSTRKATRKVTSREYEGLWDWNLISNRIHFSPGWIALTGCQDHEVGTTPDDWLRRVHPQDADQLARDLEAARADDRCEFELRYRLRHKDGTYRWMESHGLVVRNGAGEAIRLTGAQSDVTVETVTDRLTGLPNRLLLVDRLAQSIARAQRHPTSQFALLLLDLGRPLGPVPRSRAGDPLLNAAARRLETCIRMPEMLADQRRSDLVARVDGHLLAVLLGGVADLSQARLVGDRLLAEMRTPFTLGSREVRLSPAIGIALSATGYTQPETALRDAETALHRAHVLGGSHCEVFDPAVLQSEESDQQLEDDFEGALERGEFEVAYQPIVSIASRQLVGFEALMRWRHPVLGSISPAEFIPIAERTGFVVPLGRWILRESCARLKAWQSSLPSAHDVWVSVNLSGVQVRLRISWSTWRTPWSTRAFPHAASSWN